MVYIDDKNITLLYITYLLWRSLLEECDHCPRQRRQVCLKLSRHRHAS